MEAIDIDHQGYRPATLSWTSMFQQFKDHHERNSKNNRPIPTRILQWIGMQQRQYRVYGIGLKEPVGIIKHRVKKLNELGFQWNPMWEDEEESEEEEEEPEQEEATQQQQPVSTSNRTSVRRRNSNDADEKTEHAKYSSSGRRIKRRSSYASYGDDEEEAEAPPKKALPPQKKAAPKEKEPRVSGINRSAPGKKWQVRTNHPVTNERIYLGSYEHHADALAALNVYKETLYNPTKTTTPKTQPERSKKKKEKKVHKKTQKKKWKVNLNHNGEQIYIGSFTSHAEAAEALRKAKQQYSLPTAHARTKGVSLLKNGKWEARAPIPDQKMKKYIGQFDSEEEAIAAIQETLREYEGARSAVKKKNHDASTVSRERRLHMRLETKKTQDSDGTSQDGDHSSKTEDDKADDNESKLATMATPVKSNKSPANKSSSSKSIRSLFPKRLQQLPKPGYIRGISMRQTGVYEARCYIDGERKYLGRFSTKQECMDAIREAGADDFKPEYQEELARLWAESGVQDQEEANEDMINAGNDDDTVGTAEKVIDDGITSKTENDEAFLKGNGATDDSSITDGSIELDTPRTKYFPLILYQMVNDSSISTPEILEWLPCGSAFRINDHNAIGSILGKYFRSTKYVSFHRMLNLYGFSKQSIGKYDGAFKHPQFHRDISTEDTILARVIKQKK